MGCVRRSGVALALLLISIAASAQQSPAPDPMIERIVGAAMTRGGALSFLEKLTDDIGGRVTGSPESQAAVELILKTLKDAGFENAHIEEYSFSAGWKRGPASGRIVSPTQQPLLVGSYGWSPGTSGAVTVPVVTAGVARDGKLPGDLSKFRGSAVLVDLGIDTDLSFAPNYVVRRALVARQLADAGATAMMIQSEKPDRMLYTSAAGIYPRAPLPLLSVAKEDALLLRRLLGKSEVKIQLDIQNSFTTNPKERNVIADIPGTHPDEIVLLGAHFDAWEPAQGAKDNGTGVAQILEVARILKSLGVKPRSTIRFAFFSGEEQACLGSRAYVQSHKAELDHHRVALITDAGSQTPLGFLLHGRSDIEANARKQLAALVPLGAGDLATAGDLSSDDETFVVLGIPALSLYMVQGDYDDEHHTIIDTFDKVVPRELALDTAVLAVAAYELANSEQPLGRRLSSAEATEVLRKTGQLDYVNLDYAPEHNTAPTP